MCLYSGRDRIYWEATKFILIKQSKNILISAWQNLALPVKQSCEKEGKQPLHLFWKLFPRDNSYRRRDINMIIGPRETSSHLRHKALRQFHPSSDGGNTHFKQVKLSKKLHWLKWCTRIRINLWWGNYQNRIPHWWSRSSLKLLPYCSGFMKQYILV